MHAQPAASGWAIPDYDRRYWVLWFGHLIDVFGGSAIWMFLALYLYESFDTPMWLIGLAMGLAIGMGAVGQITGGVLADMFGRRLTLMVSMGGRAIIFISMLAAGSFWAFFGLILVNGFVGGFYQPSAQAVIADIVEPRRRLNAFGLFRVSQNIGFGLGSLYGGLLYSMGLADVLFMTGSMANLAALMMIAVFVAETRPRNQAGSDEKPAFPDVRAVTKDRVFVLFCLIMVFIGMMFSQMSNNYALYTTEVIKIKEEQLSILFLVNALVVIALQIPMVRFGERFRVTQFMAGGALLFGAGYLMVGLAHLVSETFLFLVCAMFVVTIGEIIVVPSASTLTANLAPAHLRGSYMGFVGLLNTMGNSMGPIIGSVILYSTIDGSYHYVIWMFIFAIGVAGCAGFWALGRLVPDEANRSHGG